MERNYLAPTFSWIDLPSAMLSKLQSEDAKFPSQQIFDYKYVDMNSRV
jgi:hypothetical protein